MSKNGYDFYLKKCLLPIAPEKLHDAIIKVDTEG